MSGHIIICGLGHIGFRCFELIQQLGIKTTVITDKTNQEWQRRVESVGGVVILGDARDEALLKKAGIDKATAILAVTDKDLVNVSITMDARRLNSNIRIVCRLFDTHLGKHISEAFKVSQVLSTSEIAAPFFCDSIEEGENFLCKVSHDHQDLKLFKENNHFILKTEPKEKTKSLTFIEKLGRWIFRPALMKFRTVLLIILAVYAAASLVIQNQMGLTLIDSLYFAATTITTVGFGDFNFATTTPAMKFFGIFLMIFGTTSLAILFSIVADELLSERFSGLFGGRPIPGKGHVVVIGGGHVGLRIAEQLHQNHDVLVIENDKTGRFSSDLKKRIAVIDGDARNSETLIQANLQAAKAILAVSEDDIDNLSIGLAAEAHTKSIKTVVRIFDADLAKKFQSKFSINSIFSVSALSAPLFVASALEDAVAGAAQVDGKFLILSQQMNPGMSPIKSSNSNEVLYLKQLDLNP